MAIPLALVPLRADSETMAASSLPAPRGGQDRDVSGCAPMDDRGFGVYLWTHSTRAPRGARAAVRDVRNHDRLRHLHGEIEEEEEEG